jgi:hypothetical protein
MAFCENVRNMFDPLILKVYSTYILVCLYLIIKNQIYEKP